MDSRVSTRENLGDEAVRDRIVDEFRRRRGEATKADLVAATGLPLARVEGDLRSVSDEYGARLRVTESGEILYSFPNGMRSRYRGLGPALRKFWKGFRRAAIATGTLIFKGWIVLMLVGYFVLFLLLALVALLVSVAGRSSGSSGRDDRGGGLGGLFVASNLFDAIIRIWFYSELFKDPNQRAWERDERTRRKKNRRPIHHAIFSFVFGEADPNRAWDETEKKAVLAWLQNNKGIITMPEFMSLTGLTPRKAEERINLYLRDFQGSPEVSEGGTIYYSFPEILRRAETSDRSFGSSPPMKHLPPFSANPAKANFWFGAINMVNLAFGAYFLSGALLPHQFLPVIYGGKYATRLVSTGGWDGFYLMVHQILGKLAGVADPNSILGLGLGAVPVAFAAFFFSIPAFRWLRWRREKESIKVDNLRRIAYRAVLDNPEGLRTASLSSTAPEASPADRAAASKILSELAAAAGGEPGEGDSWSWPEVARSRKEVTTVRAAIKPGDFALGKAVFDSHN